MTFDWTSDKDFADPVPEGRHLLKISRVLVGFKSSNGDPKILVVFEDGYGREATEGFVLSAAAAWTLRRLIARAGINREDLNARGIEPFHFTDKGLAESILCGHQVWCEVTHQAGRDGKTFTRVRPLDEKEIPAETFMGQPVEQPVDSAVSADDVPF